MAKTKGNRSVAAKRITAWIKEHHDGNHAAAARALGVEHSQLWRAAQGTALKGPSVVVLMALAARTMEPVMYWAGGN